MKPEMPEQYQQEWREEGRRLLGEAAAESLSIDVLIRAVESARIDPTSALKAKQRAEAAAVAREEAEAKAGGAQ